LKFTENHTMNRIPISFLFTVSTWAQAAGPAAEPGVLLRAGTWNGDVGSFSTPAPLADIKPSQWPTQGWFRLVQGSKHIEVSAVQPPKKGLPDFLKDIAQQLTIDTAQMNLPSPEGTEALDDSLYLRVPGVQLRSGAAPTYQFKNGTAQLSPQLDYKYELTLGGAAFAVTVQNGLRNKSGASYGDGALYTIEHGGARYEYLLEGYGWDSRISAIADLDADGKPDFIIYVGGSNSGGEFVLLSSKAKPGRNRATAALFSMGC
jgi:hypothetical protein